MIDIPGAIKGRDPLVPPRSMIFIGDGDFKKTGDEFKRYFIEIGGLQPHHRILDVGSGIGRMAAPLTSYMSAQGEYHGFDIVLKGIEWCRKEISSRYPNFHFLHADIQNMAYNPDGVYQAVSYQFPYETESFDFVFLTSVFTHMFPADMENYLKEIARVLKKNGRCFITYFLLNVESEKLIHSDLSSQKFIYDLNGCFTTDKDNPEWAIAFKEKAIRDLFAKNGLDIAEPITYGSWCGRKNFLSYQDIVLGTKHQ